MLPHRHTYTRTHTYTHNLYSSCDHASKNLIYFHVFIFSCRVITGGVWISNYIYWTFTLVATNKYDSHTELQTPKITVSTAHLKFSELLIAVAWYRLPTADVPFLWVSELPQASDISFSLLNYHICNSQTTQKQKHVTNNFQLDTLSCCPAPICGPRRDFCYCQTVAGLLMSDAFSDERMFKQLVEVEFKSRPTISWQSVGSGLPSGHDDQFFSV
jgi:hypothetical protein